MFSSITTSQVAMAAVCNMQNWGVGGVRDGGASQKTKVTQVEIPHIQTNE